MKGITLKSKLILGKSSENNQFRKNCLGNCSSILSYCLLTLGSAGTTSPATGTYAAFAGSAASLTLGSTVAYTALIIAVSGDGMSALNKLRKYKVIKKRDRYILKKK